jgi:hypothetical protein
MSRRRHEGRRRLAVGKGERGEEKKFEKENRTKIHAREKERQPFLVEVDPVVFFSFPAHCPFCGFAVMREPHPPKLPIILPCKIKCHA